jgi:hypothetical protein
MRSGRWHPHPVFETFTCAAIESCNIQQETALHARQGDFATWTCAGWLSRTSGLAGRCAARRASLQIYIRTLRNGLLRLADRMGGIAQTGSRHVAKLAEIWTHEKQFVQIRSASTSTRLSNLQRSRDHIQQWKPEMARGRDYIVWRIEKTMRGREKPQRNCGRSQQLLPHRQLFPNSQCFRNLRCFPTSQFFPRAIPMSSHPLDGRCSQYP